MRKISHWASHHTWLTRFIIIGIYLLLNLIGLFLGDLLFSVGVVMKPLFLLSGCFIVLLGLFLYPSQKEKNKYRNFYLRHKTADLLLAASTFLFITYGGNHLNNAKPASTSNLYAASVSLPAKDTRLILNKVSRENKDPQPETKKPLSKKELKKILKSKLHEWRKHYKEAGNGGKAALIILSILVAAGLILLLSALACSIACSGAEALSIVVLILGVGLIVFLLVRVIQRITKGPRKLKKDKPDIKSTS
jgi:protein-S-isoprenylcysteine O-methyltransferase Ste14